MTESWRSYDGGGDWREEAEQAQETRRALRILTCHSAACRRRRRCLAAPARCPGLQRYPNSESDDGDALKLLRMRVEERLAELEAGPEAAEAASAANAEAGKRRRRLAFVQAREILERGEG